MKAKYLLSTLGVICALSLTGCKKKNKDTYSQKIDIQVIHSDVKPSKEYFAVTPLNLNMVLGETRNLEIASIPSSYAGDKLVYDCKDTSIATVDANGRVTGVSKGVTAIEVSTTDGQASETVLVSVSEKIENEEGGNRFKAKGAAVRDPSFVRSSKVWAHEFVEQKLDKNGSTVNRSAYVEDIIFDKDEAYFEVSSEDIEVKTKDGSTAVSSGKWIFYVDQETFDTYLVHETPVAKNYMSVPTQKYLGRDAYEILYDVLDMFFLSGSSIVTDFFDDVDGIGLYDKDDANFIDCALHDYSNAKETCYAPNEDDIYAHLELSLTNQEVKPAEEFNIDVPTGTKYDEAQILDLFVRGDHVNGFDVKDVMTFKWGEDDCERSFQKQIQYFTDFEVSIPDISDYGEVDNIYDL